METKAIIAIAGSILAGVLGLTAFGAHASHDNSIRDREKNEAQIEACSQLDDDGAAATCLVAVGGRR